MEAIAKQKPKTRASWKAFKIRNINSQSLQSSQAILKSSTDSELTFIVWPTLRHNKAYFIVMNDNGQV